MENKKYCKPKVSLVFLVLLFFSLNSENTFAGKIADAAKDMNFQLIQELLEQTRDLSELDVADQIAMEYLKDTLAIHNLLNGRNTRDHTKLVDNIYERYVNLHSLSSVNKSTFESPLLELEFFKATNYPPS